MAALDLSLDVVTLTAAVCDIESVSGNEAALADAVEAPLRAVPHLTVWRDGDAVVARTDLGRSERVLLAGHLDTVPLADPPNLPTRRHGGELVGRGTVDMKGGVAVMLRLAATVTQPSRDVTFVFYDGEEVDADRNGLGRLGGKHPGLLDADFAVLLEPTAGAVEGGCKGTLRAEVTVRGRAAHSARPWMGDNAVHHAGEVLRRLVDYGPRAPVVEGLQYHEALQAVGIRGGSAGNVVPDVCTVTVNYRYAPDRSPHEAVDHVEDVFRGFDVRVLDNAGGARPGLDRPAARAFVDALAAPVRAKEGWTDVARFAELGVPAVNFGPGDPALAHRADERAPVAQYVETEAALRRWLESRHPEICHVP